MLQFLFCPTTFFRVWQWVHLHCLQMIACSVLCCWPFDECWESCKSIVVYYTNPTFQCKEVLRGTIQIFSSYFSCLAQHNWWKKCFRPLQWRNRHNCYIIVTNFASSHSQSLTHFIFSVCRVKSIRVHFDLMILITIAKICFKSVIKLRFSQLGVLQGKKAYEHWFCLFDTA